MQQVAAKRMFWWRALDAQTSGPGIAFRERYMPYPEATALSLGDHRKPIAASKPREILKGLQIPRGERRFRFTRRRRGVSPLLVAAVSLCLVAGAVAVTLPIERIKSLYLATDFGAKATDYLVASGFGIDQVNLTGQHYTLDSDVFDALDLPNVRTFAEFDSEAALKRIERLPWVDTAQLTRVYPSKLAIVIRERVPAVAWTRGSQNYLVDATGRLLGPMPRNATWNLPRVAGEGASGEAAALFTSLHRYPAIERQYAYGERIGERRWRIFLKNGTVLDLAADREIEGFEEISNTPQAAAAFTGAPKIIDVRAPGRMAIGPADRTAFKAVANASLSP